MAKRLEGRSDEQLPSSSDESPYEPLSTRVQAYRATSEPAIEELARRILDLERRLPIVGLTSRPNEPEPALDPADVLKTLDGPFELAAIPTGSPTRHLAGLLPARCEAYGGAARIWWPGFSRQSDPRDHPLIFERHGVYGSQALEQLARAWAKGPPLTEAEHFDDRDRELVLMREGNERAREQIVALAGQIHELEEQLHQREDLRREAVERARELHRAGAADSSIAAGETETEDRDPDARFLAQVFDSYLESTTAADRAAHPLAPVAVGPEFCSSLQKVEVDDVRVAFIVALLLSSRLSHNFESHALRSGRGGEESQRRRDADGALAWRISVKRNSPSAPRLHYWRRDDGVTELASVVIHDDFSIPS